MATSLRMVVSFFLTPLLARGLGQELFGAWLMIQQAAGWLGVGSMRAGGGLSVWLAACQSSPDIHQKRRLIGAAFVLYLVSLPIVLSGGVALVVFAPQLIRTSPECIGQVRLALAFCVLTLICTQLGGLPGMVLRGLNLDYRRIWLRVSADLVATTLITLAVLAQWGLPGVAAGGLVGSFVLALVLYYIVYCQVPWLGIEWPGWRAVWTFFRSTVWLATSTGSFLLLYTTDVFVVGYLFGPSVAGVYGTTGAVARLLSEPLAQVAISSGPGLAGLCGACAWDRVSRARLELHLVLLAASAVVGAGSIALNQAFMRLWVGSSFFGGDRLNITLVLSTLLMVFIRADGVVLDGLLAFRTRALATLASAMFGLMLGTFACQYHGPLGMALGIAAARLLLVVFQSWWISRRLRLARVAASVRPEAGQVGVRSGTLRFGPRFRAFVAACICWGVAAWLAPRLNVLSIPQFLLFILLTGVAAATIAWWGALDATSRASLRQRAVSGFRMRP